jgi:16S rRNA (adenine1518-N6/adenine1519-N6)-dimethyltransferase
MNRHPHRAPSRQRPRKRFGQHFLLPAWAERVVQAIAPADGDVFLEIGPGTGALTVPLAATGLPILAVEIDRDLTAALAARVPANVTLVSGDILETDVLGLVAGLEPTRPPDQVIALRPARRIRVVGNLPYNLSSPILFHLIGLYRRHATIADATLMVQREVADRLLARPGTKAYGVLTVSAQLHTHMQRLLDLPPGAFRPAPKVRSTVIRLEFGPPVARVADERLFDRMLRTLFAGRRKMLANAAKAVSPDGPAIVREAGFDGRRRPETLQVSEFVRLAEAFASRERPAVL